jgi:hypothetical protein
MFLEKKILDRPGIVEILQIGHLDTTVSVQQTFQYVIEKISSTESSIDFYCLL